MSSSSSADLWAARPPTVRFGRGLLIVVALGHLDFAYGAYYSRLVPWVVWVWAALFVAAAVSCLVARQRFTLGTIAMAGALTVTAYASRAGALAIGAATDRVDLDPANTALAAGAWLMLAAFAAVVWVRAYGPLAGRWGRRGSR